MNIDWNTNTPPTDGTPFLADVGLHHAVVCIYDLGLEAFTYPEFIQEGELDDSMHAGDCAVKPAQITRWLGMPICQ